MSMSISNYSNYTLDRDEIVSLIGGFPRFGGHFRHFCDFPRSVIKVWGGGGWPLVKLYSHHYDQIEV